MRLNDLRPLAPAALAGFGWYGARAILAMLIALGVITTDARAVEGEAALAATVRVEVPETSGPWPLRFVVGVPEGIDVEPGALSPLTVLDPLTGAPLATQSETILRRPDGTSRSLWVSATMPAGLEAGTEIEVDVLEQGSELRGPSLTPIVSHVLTKGHGWAFTVEGLEGGVYQARFGSSAEVIRVGSSEVVFRETVALEPVVPESNPALQLPHLGVVTLDVRAWTGVDALDVRVLWEGGVVDEPLAWALFRSATLRLPAGAMVVPLNATAGAGEPVQIGGATLLELATRTSGPHGTLPHHAKLWSVGVAAPWSWTDSWPILSGGGWGWADSGPWSPHVAPATASELPIPDLAFLGLEKTREAARAGRDSWREARALGKSLDGSYGPSSWRHPSGIGYGAMTGGEGIDPWPFVDLVWADPAATYLHLDARLESRLDRTRTSLVTLDGASWDPAISTAPFNVSWSPEPYWAGEWLKAWPSYSQDPAGFRGAQPAYREATAALADQVLASDRRYGTDDMQHWVRGRRALWPLVELYGEPMARFVLERQAVAVRADFYEGPAAGRYTETLAWMAARDGVGQDFGRDFAWAGHHVALAYAAGSDEERAQLELWCSTWVDVLTTSLTANGAFQVITGGKELDFALGAAADTLGEAPAFWPTQTYQEALVASAGLQMRGAFVAPSDRGPIDDSLRSLVRGLATVGWSPDAPVPDYRYAACLADGTALLDRASVEATYASSLHVKASGDDGNRYQGLHVSLPLAAHALLDAGPEAEAALERYVGANSSADVLTRARTLAPSSIANFAPLLAALEVAEGAKAAE